MKTAAFALLWLLPLPAAPQSSWNEKTKCCEDFRKQGDYDRAGSCYRESLALAGTEKEKAASSFHLATMLQRAGKHQDAETHYLHALDLFRQYAGNDSPDATAAASALGVLYVDLGRYGKAIEWCRRATEADRRNPQAAPDDVAHHLSALGDALLAAGRFDEAEEVLQQAARKWTRFDSVENAATLTELGLLYYRQARYREAERCARRGLAVVEGLRMPNHVLLIKILNLLSMIDVQAGRLSRASQTLERSIGAAERAPGRGGLHLAITLNSFGVLEYRRQHWEAAERSLLRASDTFEASLGPSHPLFALALANLATVKRAQKQYGAAEALLRRALAIDEAQLSPGHTETARVLTDLARTCASQRRYAESEPLLRRAVGIYENAFPIGHPDLGSALSAYADTLAHLKRKDESKRIRARADAILRDVEAQAGAYQVDVLDLAKVRR